MNCASAAAIRAREALLGFHSDGMVLDHAPVERQRARGSQKHLELYHAPSDRVSLSRHLATS